MSIFQRLCAEDSAFVIAELGVNHNGDLGIARELIKVAAKAGADAVKFQTFSASRLVSSEARLAPYQEANSPRSQGQHQMLSELELSPVALKELRTVCEEQGVIFVSTPFDEESVDLLAELQVPFFKISSADITHFPLLERAADKGRPMIISTGLATFEEIEAAVCCIKDRGNEQIVLLHCVTEYPAPVASLNLRAIQTLRTAFNRPIGYSDHSQGVLAAVIARALGATVIEKHLTLDKNLPGPDHRASADPAEFAELIRQLRLSEQMLGDGIKRPVDCEEKNRVPARRSIFLESAVSEGEVLAARHLCYLRPGDGISPAHYREIIGKRVKCSLPGGYKLSWNDLI